MALCCCGCDGMLRSAMLFSMAPQWYLSLQVASSPYILSAILLTFDFVVCLWMASQFKYAGEF